MIAQGALAIGQGVVALAIHDQDQRRSLWIGAGESVVGFVAVALIPCPAESAGDELRGTGATTAATRRAYAEKLLDDSADAQEQTRGWLAHAGNFVVAAAGASILWFAYKQRTDAVFSFVESLAVGELQILTAPTAAIEARQTYRSNVAVSVALLPGGGGISLAGTF
jgi:hypothetical protein